MDDPPSPHVVTDPSILHIIPKGNPPSLSPPPVRGIFFECYIDYGMREVTLTKSVCMCVCVFFLPLFAI